MFERFLRLIERLRTGAAGGAGEPRLAAFADETYLALTRDLISLDPAQIVERGLELARHVSGVERALLVGAGVEPHLEPLLTPFSDPGVSLSRSKIGEALETGRTARHFLGPDPSLSMKVLGLHRIWVHPVELSDGRRVAVLYLDSAVTGRPFDTQIEERLHAVARHIGLALTNAALYAEVLSLNAGLEQRVAERTEALERSQAQLIAQDRMATLGRLVAAIAHELNNPVGAIASFSTTLGRLSQPIMAHRSDLNDMFPEPSDRALAGAFLERVLDCVRRSPLDSRGRRAREQAIHAVLADAGVPAVELVAQRLARTGVEPDDVRAITPLLHRHADALSAMAERLHMFGRSLETIEQCASNVARIVDGLKTYAHLDRAGWEVLDVHRSIEATLSVLAPRIPDGVKVVTSFDRVPEFPHRPGELTQVWTNLVDNALRAMCE